LEKIPDCAGGARIRATCRLHPGYDLGPNFSQRCSNRIRGRAVQLAMRTTRAALNRIEILVSIKTKIAAFALAALAVTGAIASTTHAQAKGFGWGIGAGLVGAAVVGGAIAASNDGYYYDEYRRCFWVRQFDAYGNYIGRGRSCN
jgi:hypothetical protein